VTFEGEVRDPDMFGAMAYLEKGMTLDRVCTNIILFYFICSGGRSPHVTQAMCGMGTNHIIDSG